MQPLNLSHVTQLAVVETNPLLSFQLFNESHGVGHTVHLWLNRHTSPVLLHDQQQNIFQQRYSLGLAFLNSLSGLPPKVGSDINP